MRHHTSALTPSRTALLIDLENLVHGHDGVFIPAPDVDRRLRRVLNAAPEPAFVLAAAAGSVLSRYLPDSTVLRHIPLRAVSAAPDAADHLLLDQAEHLAAIGFTHFVIASGDHVFADFAATHNVVVVASHTDCLSRTLAHAAHTTRIAA